MIFNFTIARQEIARLTEERDRAIKSYEAMRHDWYSGHDAKLRQREDIRRLMEMIEVTIAQEA